MKINNRIKFWSCISALSLVGTTAIVSCSISQEIIANSKEVVLVASREYITTSSSLQIEVVNDDESKYDWSIVTNVEGVWINGSGVLFSSSFSQTDQPQKILVYAKHKKTKIQGELSIYFVNDDNPDHNNFFGFADNKITYIDRYSNPVDVFVKRLPGSIDYTLTEPINLFYQDTLPMGWTSWFDFHQIIRHHSLNQMSFHCVDFGKPYQPIVWWDAYSDGDEVDYIPNFMVVNTEPLDTKIVVTFYCNDELGGQQPHLIIPINLWNSDQILTNGIFSYFPQQSDPHQLKPSIVDGTYYCDLYCESTKAGKSYTNFMAPIYCYRELHEYLDFEFIIDYSRMDPRLKSAFSLDLKTERVERQIDHYPMYLLTLTYSFDLTDPTMPTAKECDYASLPLFTLKAKDPIMESGYAAWIDFNLCWL